MSISLPELAAMLESEDLNVYTTKVEFLEVCLGQNGFGYVNQLG